MASSAAIASVSSSVALRSASDGFGHSLSRGSGSFDGCAGQEQLPFDELLPLSAPFAAPLPLGVAGTSIAPTSQLFECAKLESLPSRIDVPRKNPSALVAINDTSDDDVRMTIPGFTRDAYEVRNRPTLTLRILAEVG